MKQVKNIHDEPLAIVGVGVVEPNEIVEVDDGFHNANFEEIEVAPSKKRVDKEADDISN